VHVDGPDAEHQLGGDLAVGVAGGDQADDLHLAAGELRLCELGGLPPAQPAVDALAELGQVRGQPLDRGAHAQATSQVIGGQQPLRRSLAVAAAQERVGGTPL
jgi:hypothetical protein